MAFRGRHSDSRQADTNAATAAGGTDRRLAAALLLTTALVALPALPPARAAEQPVGIQVAQAQVGQAQVGQARVAQADAARRTIAFDIPAQPLEGALNQFGRQAGLQVTMPGTTTAGLQSPGVSGEMSPADALTRLLSGTGLAFEFTAPETVSIVGGGQRSGATVLDPITVAGQGGPPPQAEIGNLPPVYAGGQVATGGRVGLLGNRDVMDTPFNQTSYTAKKIADQQARSVAEVLVDDPSVQIVQSPVGVSGDNIRIRGFDLWSSGVAFGGLYGIVPTWTAMAEMAERVEVLKGPSAMLTGMNPTSNIAGTVNVIPKRAPDESLIRFTPSYASTRNFGGHLDIGQRFGRDGQIGIRFNGVYRDGETAIEDNAEERGLALLGLDFRGERVRLSADLGYQHRTVDGFLPGVYLMPGVPTIAPPKASSNYAPPWSHRKDSDLFGVLRGEVDITTNITAYAAIGGHELDQNMFGSNAIFVDDAAGNARARQLRRAEYRSDRTGNAGVRTRFETGPVDHEFALEGSLYRDEGGSAANFAAPVATNIFSSFASGPPDIASPTVSKTYESDLSSLALADTLSILDERVQLTVGVRQQRVNARNFSAATGAETSSYDESALSPSVALVVKPMANVSLYGNVIQGLQQGETVGSTYANAGEVFPPFKSTQYEAGVKVDWGRFTTTASAFQITQPNLIDDIATNTLVLEGEQRNRGIEFNLFGEPIDGVRLLGGAMYLQPVLTKTQGGLNDGIEANSTPNLQLRLSGEWDTPFLPGLTLTGRGIYTGAQYRTLNAPRESFPSWTRFDVGLRYAVPDAASPTGKPIAVRLSVENVLDDTYWLANGWRGSPRTLLLSTSFDF